jgi:hypothetical protein
MAASICALTAAMLKLAPFCIVRAGLDSRLRERREPSAAPTSAIGIAAPSSRFGKAVIYGPPSFGLTNQTEIRCGMLHQMLDRARQPWSEG